MVKLPNVRGILSFREEGRPDKKMMATIHWFTLNLFRFFSLDSLDLKKGVFSVGVGML
jgi:hypothetical protein